MCGRYLLAERPSRIYKRYNIELPSKNKQPKFEPSYNIAPGFLVPVITRNPPNRLGIMKWGLIPHWTKNPKISNRLINARAETISIKPSFRTSFKNKRCLIPATGFYEWQNSPHGKLPYLIRKCSGEVFSFAGIYDVWKDVEEKEFKTFSVITTEANKLLQPVHNRMPVILNKESEDLWLNNSTSPEILKKLLFSQDNGNLEMHTVSNQINNTRNQGSKLTKRVSYDKIGN